MKNIKLYRDSKLFVSKNIKKLILRTNLVLTILLMSSCDNFVDVAIPNSQLTGSNVFEDRATANAALASIYAKLRDSGFLAGNSLGISSRLGMYADEFTYYGGVGNPEINFYNNTVLSTNPVIQELWNVSYNQIYGANALLEGVQNSTSLSTLDKNQLRGEALFIRALVHFYLVNTFGGIPYITGTNYEINRLVTRMPIAEAYQHIISDLKEASGLLAESYTGADRTRPNRSAVQALLARVFLYNGSWQEASNSASAVLNNPIYKWEENLDKVFLKDSGTTIWQFMPKATGRNTDEGSTFIFIAGPPPFVALNSSIVNSFEPTDLRKLHWVGSVTQGTNKWFFPRKYKEKSNTNSSVEYSIVFRLAEMYLIRAEARARVGNLSGAKEDLNKIRNTAGLGNTNASTTDEINKAILAERKCELFTEYGQRYFDLKRTGNLDLQLAVVKPGWNTTDNLLPLPANELIANPNLRPQNPGY